MEFWRRERAAHGDTFHPYSGGLIKGNRCKTTRVARNWVVELVGLELRLLTNAFESDQPTTSWHFH